MKVTELVEDLKLRVIVTGERMERAISGGYASDLLSDVMGHSKQDQVWITLQNHLNVIAVASLKDLAAIILVHGQSPTQEVINRAVEEGVTILGTESDTFQIAALVNQSLQKNEAGTH
jgi:predicted transcriptional regulator